MPSASVQTPAAPPAPPATPLRLRHIDSLRAVAALLVMWLHFSAMLGPLAAGGSASDVFLSRLPETVNVGRMGVMIFFAISGFVICRSFGGPREGGARRFLIKRFCRLYPAYWVSMLGGIAVWGLTGQPLSWTVVAANTTMIPEVLGQPSLLGVYWTLEIELLFYGLCLGLYLLHSLDRPLVLAACALALVWLPRTLKAVDYLAGTHLRLPPGKPTLVLGLAMMFWGALFRLVYDETGGFRRGVLRSWQAGLLLVVALALIDVPEPGFKWMLLGMRPGTVLPAQAAVAGAVLIFAVWVAWWRVDGPIPAYLGTVSYSLYLFHLVVIYSLQSLAKTGGVRLPFAVDFVGGFALSIALAALVYRWVERPAVRFGKRWASSAATA